MRSELKRGPFGQPTLCITITSMAELLALRRLYGMCSALAEAILEFDDDITRGRTGLQHRELKDIYEEAFHPLQALAKEVGLDV